jgi:competence protein ComEC
MHILAVSGMHVALLYWVLNLVLSFFDKIRYGMYFRLAILLLAIWMYALITGLSASVLRATVMFSFVIAGQAASRQISIFNSLAASAFFLLIWNPYNLIDAGFQLSYLAVLSIVVLYPLIFKLWFFENWLLNEVWSITACTIAAQIGTFPLSVYYFHQFPNLFLISNLVIIPFSTLIIYSSILLICCSFSELFVAFFGGIFNWMVLYLNKFVLYIDKLPFALWKGLYINKFEMFLVFGIIVATITFLVRKQPGVLKVALAFVLILTGSVAFIEFHHLVKKEAVFYNYQDNTVLQFRSGEKCVWLVSKMNDRTKSLIDRNAWAEGIRNVQVFLLDSIRKSTLKTGRFLGSDLWIHGQYLQFHSKMIAIPEAGDVSISKRNVPVDFVILRNESVFKNQISDGLQAKSIVLDGTVSAMKEEKIARLYANTKVEIYAMSKKGAFKIGL